MDGVVAYWVVSRSKTRTSPPGGRWYQFQDREEAERFASHLVDPATVLALFEDGSLYPGYVVKDL